MIINTKSKKPSSSKMPDFTVKLKPILGIKPELYIPVLYGTLAIFLFVLLFVVPGICKQGTYVTIETVPQECAVFAGGTYLGKSGEPHFVQKGKTTLTISKPYFIAQTVDITIKNRILFSKIFPKKKKISIELKPADFKPFVERGVNEFYQWNTIGSLKKYEVPPQPILEIGRYLSQTKYEAMSNEQFLAVLDQCVPFASNSFASKELVETYKLTLGLSNNGKLSQNLAQRFSKTPLSYINLIKYLPSKEKKQFDAEKNTTILLKNELYPKQNGKILPNDTKMVGKGIFVKIDGRSTIKGIAPEQPSQWLDMDRKLPAFLITPDFYIRTTKVTIGEYGEFLNQNPKWRQDNLQWLMEQQLVDENYLIYTNFSRPQEPVTFVSQKAADAYCRWFTQTKLQNTGLTMKLPTLSQWETAAESVQSGNLAGLYNTLWEWTSTPFSRGIVTESSYNYLTNPDYFVKGGCSVNDPREINAATSGSQESTHCGQFTGFRPVLIAQ